MYVHLRGPPHRPTRGAPSTSSSGRRGPSEVVCSVWTTPFCCCYYKETIVTSLFIYYLCLLGFPLERETQKVGGPRLSQ